MKKIKQFIYYGPGDSRNVPTDKKLPNPWITNLFSQYRQISHLGIQGDPTVCFCLNGSGDSDAITVGATSIYEIDLGGVGHITGLRFLPESLAKYTSVPGHSLIVDFVYEGV